VSQDIPREDFSEADYARFSERLEESLEAMATVLARPGFGAGPTTLGAELEVAVIDEVGRPLPVNRAVLAGALDPRISLEIDRFNLEINTRPVPLAGCAFGGSPPSCRTRSPPSTGPRRRTAGGQSRSASC
jgi:hypothetical protein